MVSDCLFHRRILKRCGKEVVELLYGGDEAALFGRVRTLQGGAERNHVQSRDGGADDAALQSRMDDLHLGLCAELCLV